LTQIDSMAICWHSRPFRLVPCTTASGGPPEEHLAYIVCQLPLVRPGSPIAQCRNFPWLKLIPASRPPEPLLLESRDKVDGPSTFLQTPHRLLAALISPMTCHMVPFSQSSFFPLEVESGC
jgi:hypothetical protein